MLRLHASSGSADMHMQHFVCLHVYADKAHGALQGQAPRPTVGIAERLRCAANTTARMRTRDSSVRCVRQIIRVIRHMLRERRWWHLPRYTFGSSSGGVIALELPLRFPFQARRGSPEVGGGVLGRWAVFRLPWLCACRRSAFSVPGAAGQLGGYGGCHEINRGPWPCV